MIRPPESAHAQFQPIVIHVSEDGKFRFPGAVDAKVPKGFERVELRTIPEIEAMERRINRSLRSEAARHVENEERFFGEIKARLRSDLRQRMQSMSPFGRAFAEAAIAAHNARRQKSSEVGGHFVILHFDQPNREPYRDDRTGWRDKKSRY